MTARRISSMPSVFGMKPDAPKSMQRRITAGSSFADTTTTGTLGYCARRYISPEKPAHARHGKIEQDEIDFAAAVEQLRNLVERSRFRDLDAREQPGDRLAHRTAKQRVIVGDNQVIDQRLVQPWPPYAAPRGRDRQFTPHLTRARKARLSAQSSIRSPAADELQHDLALVRLCPVLDQIDALPGAEP